MATDVLFPLYSIFVESIFGGVGVSILGIGFLLAILLMITRTSLIFMLNWMIFYLAVMITFYYGSIGLVAMFILSGFSFVYQLIRLVYHNYS